MSKLDEKIYETRMAVAIRAKFKCESCDEPLPVDKGELAHQIPQRKHMTDKYSAGVIHHNMNFKWMCPEHNSVASIAGDPVACEELANRIRLRILEDVAIRIHVRPHMYVSLLNKLAKVASGE